MGIGTYQDLVYGWYTLLYRIVQVIADSTLLPTRGTEGTYHGTLPGDKKTRYTAAAATPAGPSQQAKPKPGYSKITIHDTYNKERKHGKTRTEAHLHHSKRMARV